MIINAILGLRKTEFCCFFKNFPPMEILCVFFNGCLFFVKFSEILFPVSIKKLSFCV